MFEVMLRTLRQPKALFIEMIDNARLANYKIWIVVLFSLISSVSAYFATQPIAEAFPDDFPIGAFALVSAVIGAFMVSFVAWLVTGLIVRMTAGLDAKPWTVAAYSYVPAILMSLLGILLLLLFPVTLTPISFEFEDAEAFTAANVALQQELQTSTAMRIGQVLSYAGSIWGLLVIFFGVQVLTDIRARAVRTVAVLGFLGLAAALGPWLFSPL